MKFTTDEAIHALKYINLSRVHPFYSWEEMGEIRNMAIEALESVGTFIPKRGKWIYEDVDLVCSVCGTDAPIIPFKGKQYKANFCANCGTDMRGEK